MTSGDRIEVIGTANINETGANEYDAYDCAVTVDGQDQGGSVSGAIDTENAAIGASSVTPVAITGPTGGGSHTVVLECQVFQGTDVLYGKGQVTATEIGP